MKTKIVTLVFASLLVFNCTNGGKSANQTLVQEQTTKVIMQPKVEYADSISLVNSKLNLLGAEKSMKVQFIKRVSKQKDSLMALLSQLESSKKAITESKINPGIEGVYNKLNELKGIKEGLEEQAILKEKEIKLATKKIEILEEEQIVYEEQQQALIDKGAAPKEFTEVDSLLNGIKSKIKIQKDVTKNLNRVVNDTKEQIINLKSQREGLSKKIRNNYSAQEILDEFNVEEKERIENQIANVDDNLNILLGEASTLDSDYSLLTTKKSTFENSITEIPEIDANAVTPLGETSEEKSSKITLAGILILGLGVLMIIFYLIGKKRKQNKKQL